MADSGMKPGGSGAWDYKNYCAMIIGAGGAQPQAEHFSYTFPDDVPNTLFLCIKGTDGVAEWIIEIAEGRNIGIASSEGTLTTLRGFIENWCTSVNFSLLPGNQLALLNDEPKLKNIDRVVLVGHSLGGAYANFMAIGLSWDPAKIQNDSVDCSEGPQRILSNFPSSARIEIDTYGAPQLGDQNFVDYVTKRHVARAIINYYDLVPAAVPWLLTVGAPEIFKCRLSFAANPLKDKEHGSYWAGDHQVGCYCPGSSTWRNLEGDWDCGSEGSWNR